MCLALIALLTHFPGRASAHGQSKSFAEWTIDGRQVGLEVRFLNHDVVAANAWLDGDGDEKLSKSELKDGADRLRKQWTAATVFTSGLQCKLQEPSVVAKKDEVVFSARWVCTRSLKAFTLGHGYLPTLTPPHVTRARVTIAGAHRSHVFTQGNPTHRFEQQQGWAGLAWSTFGQPIALLGVLFVLLLATEPQKASAVGLALGLVGITLGAAAAWQLELEVPQAFHVLLGLLPVMGVLGLMAKQELAAARPMFAVVAAIGGIVVGALAAPDDGRAWLVFAAGVVSVGLWGRVVASARPVPAPIRGGVGAAIGLALALWAHSAL